MNRLLVVLTGFGMAVSLTAGLATVDSAAMSSAPAKATITIRHQLQGCHTWSANGNAFRAAQTVSLARGGTITFVDNDVMPHKLVQTGGPAVRFLGSPAMRHMSASVKALFAKVGVYRFTTKAGEDYMSGVKTIGEDNVLRLTVVVS